MELKKLQQRKNGSQYKIYTADSTRYNVHFSDFKNLTMITVMTYCIGLLCHIGYNFFKISLIF